MSADIHNNKKMDDDLAYCVLWSPLPPITWLIPVIGHLGICDSRGVASDFQGPYFVGDDGRMAFGAPTRAIRFGPSSEIQDVLDNNGGGIVVDHNNNNNNNDDHDHDDNNNNEIRDSVYSRMWDQSIWEANDVYRGRMHNICCDNCHSHVANALNRMVAKLIQQQYTSTTTTTTTTTIIRNKKKKTNGVTTSTNGPYSLSFSPTMTKNWNMVKLAFLVFFRGRFLSWYAIYSQFGPFVIMVLILTLTTTLSKK